MGFFSRIFRSDPPSALRKDQAPTLIGGGIWAPNSAGGGWGNPVSGLGVVGVDPSAHLTYGAGRIPLPSLVDSLYTHDWLADRIIEKMPQVAMVRGYRGVEPELSYAFESLNTTERFPRGAFETAVYDARGYGGSVLLLGYKKGNPRMPLTPSNAAGGVGFLDVFRQHELRVLQRYQDPNRGDFGMPSLYEVVDGGTAQPHPRVGQIFHASRAIRFAGRPLRVPNPGLDVGDLTGTASWPELGVSVLTPALVTLAQFGLAWSAVTNMLQDASIGWMKIAGLVEALASEDKELIEDRLKVLQQSKGTHRLMFLDADHNEEYGRTEVRLTDVPSLLQMFILQVSGMADVPARVFFSAGAQGLNANSGNESDLTQLYNTCQDFQRRYLGPKLDRLLTSVAATGTPVRVEWPSLWESSDNEKAQTRMTHANADKIMWDMGFSAKDIGKARREGTFVELVAEPEDDRETVAGGGEPEDPPTGAPGAQQAAKIAKEQRATNKTVPGQSGA